jgi:hypothetical protein
MCITMEIWRVNRVLSDRNALRSIIWLERVELWKPFEKAAACVGFLSHPCAKKDSGI